MPLFVSHRQLRDRKTLPRATVSWALDSGAFSEIAQFGQWTTSVASYVEAVLRYESEIGSLDWAAPMDWMCEDVMLEKTGLTIREHQERAVQNYLDLRGRGPFIPVLQGWSVADYLRCADLYEEAGVDLYAEALVGVGSVCRRQDTSEIGEVMRALQPLRLHGFGVKIDGVARYGHLLESSDSMAWSSAARWVPALPGCPHKSCANCLKYALKWRDKVLNKGGLFCYA